MARHQLVYLLAHLAVATLLVAGLSLLARKWKRHAASRRARNRSLRAVEGERDAEDLLANAGFQVLDRQPRTTWTVTCDGERVAVDLRADLLVERDGLRYVAEVKTGVSAPQLANPSTRRQLLEYRVAYGVDAALLVDMEERRITEVEFSVPDRTAHHAVRPRRIWKAVIASALTAAAASASLTRWLLQ